MDTPLTLADVRRRNVSIDWPEAVAVVRSVNAALLERAGQLDLAPDLHQVEISASGKVTVSGGVKVDEPVRRLGQILQAALGQSEPPVQLRLVMSQATAPTPAFGSIQDYDEALAYFDRPNREAVLQALYRRAADAPESLEPTSDANVDKLAPLAVADRPEDKAQRRINRTKVPRPLLAIAAAAVLFAVAAAYYARLNGLSDANALSALTWRTADVLGDAMMTGASAVTERAGLGRLVPAIADASVTLGPHEERRHQLTVRPAVSPRTNTTSTGTRQEPFAAFDIEPIAALPLTHAWGAVVDAPQAVSLEAPIDGEPETQTEVITYSQESEMVSPPVAIRPQLPRELPPDIDPRTLSRIEVIVLPDGTVDSVRVLAGPHSVLDFMLLSAVKAWQFEPATIDGVPVRFRKTIWIATE